MDMSSVIKKFKQLFQSQPQTREELIQLLHQACKQNLFDGDALSMMEGAMLFSDLHVRDIMIPRSQMIVIDQSAKADDILSIVVDSGHSRFPVIMDDIDDVAGIILAKDLLNIFVKSKVEATIKQLVRPVIFVPESKRINNLLREFRSKRNHMAIVIDEYGHVTGLITIEDILEEIVGEIEDETDTFQAETIKRLSHGKYLISGMTRVEQFNEYFQATLSDEQFDTISGLVINALGYLPKTGERITIDQFAFRIVKASKRRIVSLKLSINK